MWEGLYVPTFGFKRNRFLLILPTRNPTTIAGPKNVAA